MDVEALPGSPRDIHTIVEQIPKISQKTEGLLSFFVQNECYTHISLSQLDINFDVNVVKSLETFYCNYLFVLWLADETTELENVKTKLLNSKLWALKSITSIVRQIDAAAKLEFDKVYVKDSESSTDNLPWSDLESRALEKFKRYIYTNVALHCTRIRAVNLKNMLGLSNSLPNDELLAYLNDDSRILLVSTRERWTSHDNLIVPPSIEPVGHLTNANIDQLVKLATFLEQDIHL
jgi:hypothetical protein